MHYRLLIDGELVAGAATLDVVNPATGKVFATAQRADAAQAERAIAAAVRAFPGWSRRSYAERGSCIAKLADAVEARRDDFARLLTREQGKPIQQAHNELDSVFETLRFYAAQELSSRVLRETASERIVEQRYPLGVVAAICPWNFPLLLLALKMAPALVTGNVVIAKPAPTTPLTTLLLGEVAADIFPPGIFQTIVDDNDLGALIAAHDDVDHVSFTGSTPTGKKVLHSAADTLKRFTLELGGNDAAIVLDDADVDAVAPKIFAAATYNAGQVCLATKRVYAPTAMLDPLCAILGRLADEAIVGDGLEQGTTIGPLQNRAQFDKVSAIIAEAAVEGTIVAGGAPGAEGGFFVKPTIVRDLSDDALLVREEQFGPVLPVLGYDDLDDAIARVNASAFGLGGIVWSGDLQRGLDVASRIESGTVWVNKNLDLPLDVPYGGAKQSGIGVQQGVEAMHDYTQLRIVNAALA